MASLVPISGVLGLQRAAHLLRRATMGPSVTEINSWANMTIQSAIVALMQPDTLQPFPKDPNTGTDWIYPNVIDPNQINNVWSPYTKSWWLENMRGSSLSLHARMMWFYYTHFPMIMTRIEWKPQFPIDYLRLIHFYALGNYKELAKAMCIDNAMLIHLDGRLNIKGSPQENFGREFLELFTVGKGSIQGPGNYTSFSEVDVQALTKLLTGWGEDSTFQSIDPVTNIPRGKVKSSDGVSASQHDISQKSFSSAFSNTSIQTGSIINGNASISSVSTELDESIDMIFNSIFTAKHFCRRIYREFVYYKITPEIETDIIDPLAALLVSNNFDVTPVLEMLLSSEHFYDVDTPATSDNNIGAIIKSPVDLVIGTMRLFNLSVPMPTSALTNHYNLFGQLESQLSLQGLELFEPLDVAGHDAYFQEPHFQRNWISANYLANRYKFAEYVISGFNSGSSVLMKLDVLSFIVNHVSNPSDAQVLVSELVAWLLPINLDTTRFDYFKNEVFLNLGVLNWTSEWQNYQNTSNEIVVRTQLELLMLALMQSPEYQLY